MLRYPFLATTALFAAAPALAQPNEILVTGRGLEESRSDQLYDAITLGRDRLAGSASNRLENILGDIAGFQNFRRSDARSANPTSQGATLRSLGGNASSRALVTLDGVPQTDPFGGWIYWPTFDPRRLGMVRVVRGGGSGTYGPGALAGTIELFSAGPDEVSGPFGEIAYGSRDSVDAFAGIGGAIGQSFAMASASYARGDGFVPTIASQRGPVDRPSPYEQASVAVRGFTPIGRTTELQLSGLWFTDTRERGTAFTRNDTDGIDGSVRLVGQGSWHWSLLGYYQKRDYYNSFASVNAARTMVTQSAEQYDVPSNGSGARFEIRPPIGDKIELRLGADWRRTKGETRELFSFVNGVGTRRRLAGGETQTAGAFAEFTADVGKLLLSGGARIDRWWIRDGFLHERVIASNAVLNDLHYPDRSGTEPTGRAGLIWRSGPLGVRAAGYIGWRLPTLNELYRPFRVGLDATAANPGLDPERLKGVEIGVDYNPLSTAKVSATLFANRLTNAIGNVTLGQGPGSFPGVGFVAAGGSYSQRQNLDAILAKGVELDGSIAFGRLTFAASYSHVWARVKSDGAAAQLDGLRPAQTARDNASATIGWRARDGASAALTVRYAGSRSEDDLGTRRLPDATTIDGALDVPLYGKLSIQARAENLTGARVVAGISGAGIVERVTPRTLWIGLRLKS